MRLTTKDLSACPSCGLTSGLIVRDVPTSQEFMSGCKLWHHVRCALCTIVGPRGDEHFDPIQAWNLMVRSQNSDVWDYTTHLRNEVLNLLLPALRDKLGWEIDPTKGISPHRWGNIQTGVHRIAECMANQLVALLEREKPFRNPKRRTYNETANNS